MFVEWRCVLEIVDFICSYQSIVQIFRVMVYEILRLSRFQSLAFDSIIFDSSEIFKTLPISFYNHYSGDRFGDMLCTW